MCLFRLPRTASRSLAHLALLAAVADDEDRRSRAHIRHRLFVHAGLDRAVLPSRRAPSTVAEWSAFAAESRRTASAEKPPKTTLWTVPHRVASRRPPAESSAGKSPPSSRGRAGRWRSAACLAEQLCVGDVALLLAARAGRRRRAASWSLTPAGGQARRVQPPVGEKSTVEGWFWTCRVRSVFRSHSSSSVACRSHHACGLACDPPRTPAGLARSALPVSGRVESAPTSRARLNSLLQWECLFFNSQLRLFLGSCYSERERYPFAQMLFWDIMTATRLRLLLVGDSPARTRGAIAAGTFHLNLVSPACTAVRIEHVLETHNHVAPTSSGHGWLAVVQAGHRSTPASWPRPTTSTLLAEGWRLGKLVRRSRSEAHPHARPPAAAHLLPAARGTRKWAAVPLSRPAATLAFARRMSPATGGGAAREGAAWHFRLLARSGACFRPGALRSEVWPGHLGGSEPASTSKQLLLGGHRL